MHCCKHQKIVSKLMLACSLPTILISNTVLVDKDYQGIASEVFVVHLFRQPPHGALSVTKKT